MSPRHVITIFFVEVFVWKFCNGFDWHWRWKKSSTKIFDYMTRRIQWLYLPENTPLYSFLNFGLVIAGRSQVAFRPQQCEGNVKDVFGFAFNYETKKWSQKTGLEVQKAWHLWHGYLFNFRFVFTLVVRFWIRHSAIIDTSNRVM